MGAYGIINTVLMMFLMIIMGLNQGTQPIIGYNYGAGNYKRVRDPLYAVKIATIITVAGALIGLFSRCFCCSFYNRRRVNEYNRKRHKNCRLCNAIGWVSNSFFKLLSEYWICSKSLIQSLSRQLIFLVPGIILYLDYGALMACG